MGKFLLGLLTGAVLAVLIVVIGFFAVASLRSKPAAVADGSTLILRLSGDVPEKAPVEVPIPFLEGRSAVTVENVWSMLRHAATDSRIRAVVFEPEDVQVGWAKMQEIRADIEEFRKSGKPVYAYLKAPGTREYYMATACTRIYLTPTDMLNLKGVGLGLVYFKNTLDKLGVQVEVEHAGKYKDFGDMFTKTSMSPETKEVMNSIADDVYADLVAVVAKGRHKDAGEIRATIDEGPFLAGQARQKGLIDELRYEDEMLGDLKKVLKQTELKKIGEHDYMNVPDAASSSPDRVAFVVGQGSITRGGEDSNGNGLESTAFVKILNKVGGDAGVKAVIVRIDSPGGEVTASDEMWRAMNELHKKKPMVISMSDAAASGGYYMAMSGDTIVAYPGTETGSIGVVFGKPNLRGLYEKVGVSKDFVSRGKMALLESDYQSLSEAGRKKLREGIDANYEDFVKKVADSRKRPVDEIEPVAQGRVWMGDQAKEKGLVDELGGIDRAIELVKKKAGIPTSAKVRLVIYPAKRSLFEVLFRASGPADAEAWMSDALVSRAGLGGLKDALRNDRLRIWMRGGMLRMMPFEIEFQ